MNLMSPTIYRWSRSGQTAGYGMATTTADVLSGLVLPPVAVIAVRVWSRRPGWCDRQILALTAGAPFACAWHAVTSTLAFDSAPLIVARGSPRWASAALALAAVWRVTGDAHSAS